MEECIHCHVGEIVELHEKGVNSDATMTGSSRNVGITWDNVGTSFWPLLVLYLKFHLYYRPIAHKVSYSLHL